MNIFDVISHILRVKHKKVTKISILAPQVYDICSLGGMINSMFTLRYQERLFLNIVILWKFSGIKSTEEQYIIAIYQINTNSISVQVWNLYPLPSFIQRLLALPIGVGRQRRSPTLVYVMKAATASISCGIKAYADNYISTGIHRCLILDSN